MKRVTLIMTLSILILPAIAIAKKPYKAVVTQPIVDAVGSPIQTFFPQLSPEQGYALLPVSEEITAQAMSCCPRMHQLLCNEIVTVIKEQGQEALIKITNCFYTTPSIQEAQCSYWILKKNITPLKELKKNGVDTHLFPLSISFDDADSVLQKKVLTLIKPWQHPVTGQLFSAGTRFLESQEGNQTESPKEDTKNVYVFEQEQNDFVSTTIPASFFASRAETAQEKIALFLDILRQWCHLDGEYIPYVWGGGSFTATTNQPYKEERKGSCCVYTIKGYTHAPKPGFDCANMIMRAAQIAGIPFFFKNTHTILEHIQELTPEQTVQPGDIIWIPGHVLVVADVRKNTVIEARGYKNKGQGKVHEIALKKVFKNMHTFDDLLEAWRNQAHLERLGRDGSVIEIIKKIKLLSLQSIME